MVVGCIKKQLSSSTNTKGRSHYLSKLSQVWCSAVWNPAVDEKCKRLASASGDPKIALHTWNIYYRLSCPRQRAYNMTPAQGKKKISLFTEQCLSLHYNTAPHGWGHYCGGKRCRASTHWREVVPATMHFIWWEPPNTVGLLFMSGNTRTCCRFNYILLWKCTTIRSTSAVWIWSRMWFFFKHGLDTIISKMVKQH